MTWQQTFDRIAAHYARLAMQPGWWAQAQHQVRALESDPEHGQLWQGLRAEVGRRIRAAGFRPDPSEQANWWDAPSRLPAPRRWRGG